MNSPLPIRSPTTSRDASPDALARFIVDHPRLFVLTGAGCSTESGIADYRDHEGAWKHRPPVDYRDFIRLETTRRRYWARSLAGWPRFAAARPNAAHRALARMEAAGLIDQLVTQNVDGLHQQSGSRRVIDLHGRLDAVICLGCGAEVSRAALQEILEMLNPGFVGVTAHARPDGDAELEDAALEHFRVPACARCAGLLKPAVVFFGECVPAVRVESAHARLAEADAVLVVGSSLMVFSGYRFCRAAAELGKPIAAVNLGRTRADDLLAIKVLGSCGAVLESLAATLGLPGPQVRSESDRWPE